MIKYVFAISLLLSSWPMTAQEQHTLFTELLSQYVQDGQVDYAALCEDPRLDQYMEQLAAMDVAAMADPAEQHAFWLNLYNAFTLKVICQNYPVKSITDLHWGGRYIGFLFKRTVWDTAYVELKDQRVNLNAIEHSIVRPTFKDPRSHFALVCASISCPPLRSEAFEAHKLEEQLDDQGEIFMRESNKNYFDLTAKKAYISPIFKWFKEDFGENEEERLLLVARFAEPAVAAAIRANPEEWKIKHTDYDWGLNE